MSKVISTEVADRAFTALNSPEGLTAFADRLKPTQMTLRAVATMLTKNQGEDVAAVFMHVTAFVWYALDENVTKTLTPEAFGAAAEEVDRRIVAHRLVQPVDHPTLRQAASSIVADQPHLATYIAALIWQHVEVGHIDIRAMGRILRDVAAIARALELTEHESARAEELPRPLQQRQRVPLTYEAANQSYEAFAKDPTEFQAFATELLKERPELEAYLEHAVSSWQTGTRVTGTLLAVATAWHYFDTGLILDITTDEIQTALDTIHDRAERFEHPTAAQVLPEEPELARAINDWIYKEISIGLIPVEFAAAALKAIIAVVKVLYDKTVGMVLYYEAVHVHEDFLRDTAKRDALCQRLLAEKPGLATHMQLLKAHSPDVTCGSVILALPTIWQCLDPDLTCDLTTSELNFASRKIREWALAQNDNGSSSAAVRALATQPQLGLALSDQMERAVEANVLQADEAELALKMTVLIACALDFKVKGVNERDTFQFVPPLRSAQPAQFTAEQIAAARASKKSHTAQPSTSSTSLVGYIREPSGAACFVDLDPRQLPQQLKEIIDGPFDAIVRENAAPGVHFVQLVGRSELSSSVWLRTRLNARGASAGSRKVLVNGKRSAVPLTRFVPAAASTLLTDDAALIEAKFYTAQSANATPSVQTGAIDAATHEAIVANYLGICERLNLLIEATEHDDAARKMKQDAERIWPSLRDAVIFEMSSDAYVQLYAEFAYYIARSAKVSIHPSESVEEILDQLTPAAERRVTELIRSGAAAPFPEKLPFKSCFFAYGAGVNETERLAVPAFVVGADTGMILGHLVCESGEVVRFAQRSVGAETALQFESERLPGQFSWAQPHNLAPWIVNALIDYVNEHKTLVEMGKIGAVYRATVKKITARLKLQPVPPPPFYVVYMKDDYVRETGTRQAALIKRHIDWQHRWKVRGHDCIRFQRGPLPIDPELLERFTKRGYKVFTDTLPDAETFADLHKRGVPEKGPDEWIAILKYWREPYEKGPDDKPLIESVRRSTKKFDPLPDDVN